MARPSYDHQEIEKRAQEKWAALDLYTTDLTDTTKDPYFLLIEFPYPSGDLHVGHWYAFAITDIYARFMRAKGKNVLFPFGFDAFGLPAENAAIKRGLDPREWTYQNMDAMRTQIRSMGTSFDWSKEVVTCDPEYYKWTQWLFSKLFDHDLAYRAEAAVKWCPVDQTVLANEQVIDGHCERCGAEVVEKRLTQWFMKITEYAERLLQDLDGLPWREEIKDAQRAWIGKSEGAKLRFQVVTTGGFAPTSNPDGPSAIEVFTTRPDTIFGATYVVLAPEHPLVDTYLPSLENAEEVTAYRTQTSKKTERERSENKEKTGVELKGVRAINPATTEEIPVYVADYVLASYGTGAVMAVPAHDERDFAFAQKYQLPIRHVIDPVTGEPQQDPKDKQKIVAVVEHEGKVLTIVWPKELGGRLLVGGTANEDEAPAITAAREIAEETGYTDLELVEQAEEMVHHSYYAFSKKQATIAHTTILHFRLKSDAQSAPQLEEDELGKFTVEWVTPEQARTEIHDDQHQYALARFMAYGAYSGDGLLRNSGVFDGQPNRDVMGQIVEAIGGERTTNYRLRDWLVSRQRYWGCPIPIVYDPEGKAHLVPAEHLPWTLPTDVDFAPSGEQSPLATSKELRERVTSIFGEGWTPEFDTLDTFVDSSWYYTRYLAPHDDVNFSDPSLMKTWLPVNRYSGGSEHTTMHLLYARFFYKALHDLALVPTSEPFLERFNRGLVMGPDGHKMSKSKGNVVNPDEYVQKYGADAVRMYLAFIGPYNEPGSYPWKPEGVESMRRFLDRIVALQEKIGDEDQTDEEQRAIAKAAEKIATDSDRFKLNTAIAALMNLMNQLEALPGISRASALQLNVLLAPFAPHLSEYLFQTMRGHLIEPPESIHQVLWPEFDAALLTADTLTLGVQVAGKRRGEVMLSDTATEEEALSAALELPAVRNALGDAPPARVIYVQGKILNLVPGKTA